jgi:Asp-tRNA(Asn)/Glu-tRNA(Gln) amidotransferase A subunit family amidase
MNGAIVMGKTVTAEFAVHTPNGTINPHNSEHITGTSSSGSAASVATFMVPIALASQTAGSIIRPSSFCGVYGFKPSFGIVPRTGILKTTDSLDTVGLMARNNEDVRLAFDSLREYGADYPYIHQYLEDPKRQTRTNRPWRIALIKTPVRENESSEVKQALNKFANDIVYNNILIDEVDLPFEVNKAHDVHKTIYDKTLSYYFQSEFAKNKDEISDIMLELINHGRTITLNEYKNALKEQYKIGKVLDSFFEKHDIILVPSTSTPAPKLGEKEKPDTSLIWTFCGNPALSVPQFKTSDDLPFGLQVVARKYNDYLLLNFVDMLREEHHIIKDVTMMPKYLEKSLKVTAG